MRRRNLVIRNEKKRAIGGALALRERMGGGENPRIFGGELGVRDKGERAGSGSLGGRAVRVAPFEIDEQGGKIGGVDAADPAGLAE